MQTLLGGNNVMDLHLVQGGVAILLGIILAFCISWSHNQLSVNTKIARFWKILLAGTEKAYIKIR